MVSALRPLDVDGLVRVLKEPRNALVKQYQKLFEMEEAELTFSEDALRAIARRAQEKETGRRTYSKRNQYRKKFGYYS